MGARPDWMETLRPDDQTRQKKYVVFEHPWTGSIGTRSSCAGDLGKAVQQLKRGSLVRDCFAGGVKTPVGVGGAGIDR